MRLFSFRLGVSAVGGGAIAQLLFEFRLDRRGECADRFLSLIGAFGAVCGRLSVTGLGALSVQWVPAVALMGLGVLRKAVECVFPFIVFLLSAAFLLLTLAALFLFLLAAFLLFTLAALFLLKTLLFVKQALLVLFRRG